MKIFQTGSLSFLAVVLLLTSSCTDQLDLPPLSAIGDNGFYTNTDEVEGGVIAMYDGLQNVPLREFALTEIRSDNARTKSREGDWAQFEELAVQPTNQAISDYWINNYNVIFRANRVLESLDVVTDAGLRGEFEGEARFVRALAHFNLVRAYGNVPLVDRVIGQEDEEYFDNDTPEAVYAAIEADFDAAARLLPSASNQTFGRATSGAAKGLLAKVKLTLGKYGEAESLLREIINSGEYALQEEYADVFYSEGNNEILFAIRYTDDDANESQDFSFEFTNGGSVSGLNFLTDELAAAIEEEDEERRAVLSNPLVPAENAKFLTQSSDVRLAGNDWIVLRYADVLLMLSEALLTGGESTTNADAIDAYNQVRERVGLSTLDDELTAEMLLMERRIELAFENHRLYDLIRFGVAQDVLLEFAVNNNFSFSASDLLLPIPQAQINVSNGLLRQNPGY